ncbi:hypothetical protein ACCO45_003675 [Purpureocillium lilacinum]|uniref:Uncharacterized protein n=1 Tax=Purpureocillium lilacinum TaxID=33203 RepID=A0ACC4E0K8_PURLI
MSYTDFDHLPLGRRGGAAGHVTSARPAAAAGGPPAWPGLPFLNVQSDDDGAPPNTRLSLPANSDSTVPLPSTDAGAMAQGRFGGKGAGGKIRDENNGTRAMGEGEGAETGGERCRRGRWGILREE